MRKTGKLGRMLQHKWLEYSKGWEEEIGQNNGRVISRLVDATELLAAQTPDRRAKKIEVLISAVEGVFPLLKVR